MASYIITFVVGVAFGMAAIIVIAVNVNSGDGIHKACINCKPRNNCKYILNEYGYCCYYISSDDAWIFNLYIYKEFRRLGHAKEIIQMCITAIRKNGYKKEIKIEAEPTEDSISMEDLVVFYRKMGLIVMNSTFY